MAARCVLLPRRRQRLRSTWAAALLGMVMLGATACGGGPEGSGKTDTDGTIRVGFVSPLASLDPLQAKSEFNTSKVGLWGIYDRLFTLTPEGEVTGMLVTDYAFGDGGRRLTMTLRDDATFSDGSSVDASAVKVNLDRARTLNTPVVKARLAAVSKVAVKGERTVVLTLSKPSPEIMEVLAQNAGSILSPKLIASGDPDTEADGSGPYKVESFVPNETLSMVRKSTPYWDPKAAKAKRFTYAAYPDPTAYQNALTTGQIDIGQFFPDQAKPLLQNDSVDKKIFDQGIATEMNLNTSVAPLDDVRVRRAMNFALDKQAIVKAFYPGSKAKYQYYRKGMPGYDPAVGRIYDYDPPKARDLLAAAGYDDGVDLGTVLLSEAADESLGAVIQQQMAKVGIRFKLQVVDGLEINLRFAEGKNAADITFTTSGTSSYTGATYRWENPINNPGGTTPEFARILGSITPTTEKAEYDAAMSKLDRYVVESAWSVPLVSFGTVWATSPLVHGLGDGAPGLPYLGPTDMRYVSIEGR